MGFVKKKKKNILSCCSKFQECRAIMKTKLIFAAPCDSNNLFRAITQNDWEVKAKLLRYLTCVHRLKVYLLHVFMFLLVKPMLFSIGLPMGFFYTVNKK